MFIYTYKLKVGGAHAPLGPTVDTPLLPLILPLVIVLYIGDTGLMLYCYKFVENFSQIY